MQRPCQAHWLLPLLVAGLICRPHACCTALPGCGKLLLLAAETLNSSWQGPKRSDMSSWGRRQARVAAVCCLTPLVVMGPASCPAAALISGGRLVVGGWTRGKRACQEDGSCGLQTAQHCVQAVLCQRDKHCWPAAATSQPLTCYIGRYTDALAGARCGARRRVSLDGTVAYKEVQVPETLQLGVWVAVLMMRQCQLGRSCSNEKGNAVSFSLQVGVPGIADDLMLGTNAHARLSTQAATARPGKHDAAAANRLPSPWPQSKPW